MENQTTDNLPGLMTIFAHPDDESFGMAGSLARAVMTGRPVTIVCATRGEEGKIADPSLATQENLGQVREQERHGHEPERRQAAPPEGGGQDRNSRLPVHLYWTATIS